jgi:hypothetical protein
MVISQFRAKESNKTDLELFSPSHNTSQKKSLHLLHQSHTLTEQPVLLPAEQLRTLLLKEDTRPELKIMLMNLLIENSGAYESLIGELTPLLAGHLVREEVRHRYWKNR